MSPLDQAARSHDDDSKAGLHAHATYRAMEALKMALANGALCFEHLAKLYLSEKEYQAASGVLNADGFATRRRYIDLFARFAGQEHASDLSTQHIVRFLADHPEWKSPHTKSDVAAAIVAVFRWAADRRYLNECRVSKPRGMWLPLQPRKAIRPEEYKAILRFARQSNGIARRRRPSSAAFRLALMFLWESGARTKEMRELDWTHVDWEQGQIRMRSKSFTATGIERLIPVTRNIGRILILIARAKLARGQRLEGKVFTTSRGHAWKKVNFGDQFRDYARMAGVRPKITAYCLRHGFTVRCLEGDLSDRQTADLLGHSGTRYVSWYGKDTRRHADYLRSLAERVSRPKRLHAPSIDASNMVKRFPQRA